jgi:hypothetical protein
MAFKTNAFTLTGGWLRSHQGAASEAFFSGAQEHTA